MASHPSRRGSNFCRFLASDVEKTTIFWESTLCEIIAFFRTRQSRCKTKFQKRSSYFLFLVMFLHCAFWVVHDVRLGVRKNAIFGARFSARDNTVFFWLQRSHGGEKYHSFRQHPNLPMQKNKCQNPSSSS